MIGRLGHVPCACTEVIPITSSTHASATIDAFRRPMLLLLFLCDASHNILETRLHVFPVGNVLLHLPHVIALANAARKILLVQLAQLFVVDFDTEPGCARDMHATVHDRHLSSA